MMTECERNFRVNSAMSVAANLYWAEVTAKVDYEFGYITRQEYKHICRLHGKAERIYQQRLAMPYAIDFTKDYSRKSQIAQKNNTGQCRRDYKPIN